MRIFLAVLTVLVMGAFHSVTPASAQPVLNTSERCTTPVPNDPVAPTDEKWVYCDFHMRQFAHREKMIELRATMDERAKNFKASTYDVRENYKKELKKYHESLGEKKADEDSAQDIASE